MANDLFARQVSFGIINEIIFFCFNNFLNYLDNIAHIFK